MFPTSLDTGAHRPVGRDLCLLTILCALLFGLGLGSPPLPNPDESRYAEIPREMLATGDWVTPRLNGVNYFEKPPLVYWMVAVNEKVFGLNEWSVRAVPALFALGGVLFTYGATRRLYGGNAGLAAGAILATSLLYFALARILLLDMAVSVLMSAALFCFVLGVREPPGTRRRWLFYGVYASMALATLTKGLIGFFVTGAVMFLWLLVCQQWRNLRPLYLPTGALLFLALAAPWHVLAALRNPTWVHRYFVFEHWERFTSPVAGRAGPWWYFGPILLVGLFPWTGFLPGVIRQALSGGWAARKENAVAWFLLIWAAFIFLFFSVSHSKLPPYILPVFPPLAALLGGWLTRVIAADERWLGHSIRVFIGCCALLAAAVVVVVFVKSEIVRDPARALALRPFAVAVAVVLFAGGGLTWWLHRRWGTRPALAALLLTTVGFYATLTQAVPIIQRAGTRDFALLVKARAQPGDRVLNYHEFFHDFAFYAERTVDVVGSGGAQPFGELELEEDAAARAGDRFMDDAGFRRRWTGSQRLWVVAEKGAVKPLFADPSFRYYLLGETRWHYLFSNQP